jgi:hypothetical protein
MLFLSSFHFGSVYFNIPTEPTVLYSVRYRDALNVLSFYLVQSPAISYRHLIRFIIQHPGENTDPYNLFSIITDINIAEEHFIFVVKLE